MFPNTSCIQELHGIIFRDGLQHGSRGSGTTGIGSVHWLR